MANKRVLILYHSFSGQTQRAVFKVQAALEADGHAVDIRRIRPTHPWKRPVKRTTFLWRNALDWLGFNMKMPIRPLQIDADKYDHIILGAQTWHLRPSYPVGFFLDSPMAEVFRGKKVSLILTCRNRYSMVVDTIENKVVEHGGSLGEVFVLCNKADHMRPTLYYIFNDQDPQPGDYWFGKTGRPFAFSEEEMDSARAFGEGLSTLLSQDMLPKMRHMTIVNKPE